MAVAYTRKQILKFIYTLCIWTALSIACLWLINGVHPRNSSQLLKERFSLAEMDYIEKRNPKHSRSVSRQLSAAEDIVEYTTKTHIRRLRDNTKTTDAKLARDNSYSSNETISNQAEYVRAGYKIGLVREMNLRTSPLHKLKGDNRGPLLKNKRDHQGDTAQPDRNNSAERARRLPQALIIGVKKCGTRALLEYLRIHPNIRAPGPEPHFFDRYYHLGLDWYREKMPVSHQHQLTIEKTPKYFVNSEVPERVYRMSRDIKLIVVVRDPVTRAISDFTQAASKQLSLNSTMFEKKAFKCKGKSHVNTHWSGINTGMYISHLQKWLQYFPYKNLHFVSGENLIKNPAQELESIQDFLNIPRFIGNDHFYFNETKGFPCVNKDMSKDKFQCFNSRKGRPHVQVSEQTIQRLRTFFEPYNREFYRLVGRNFGW